MNNQPVYLIDGRHLYYTFLAGAKGILQNQVALNKINVFPVKDKDTGTNLASTVRSIVENVQSDRSFANTAGVIAEAALMGARGNSGVIFAQFLCGLSLETNNRHVLNFSEFAEVVRKSVQHMYQAVANPVEGTMLTVMSDWAEFLYLRKDIVSDFNEILIDSLKVLAKSLVETKEKLKVLKQYDVVDAGAKGFVVFIEGVIDLILNRNVRYLAVEAKQVPTLEHHDDLDEGPIKYRYCTEALIKSCTLDQMAIQELLNRYGDSAVVAGASKFTRIHVHTNQPAELFHELKDFGITTSHKVDDMVRQQEISTRRKWNIALVTDSTCDLSQELIDCYQIHVVPINLSFGECHYLDKVTITPKRFYDMLDSSSTFPHTSQINERTFTNLYTHLASHYDAIVAIHLSGLFSGTMMNSKAAAERVQKEFNKPIHVFDSKNLSGALGLILLRTAMAIESGLSLERIIQLVDDWIPKAHVFVSVKTLKYMVKGGRVSKPKGLISNILNIKPIVSMDKDGHAKLIGKTFSQVSNMKLVLKKIKALHRQEAIWNYVVLHAHNANGAEDYTKRMQNLTGKEPVAIVDISPVIGMNAGVGATAVSIMLI